MAFTLPPRSVNHQNFQPFTTNRVVAPLAARITANAAPLNHARP